MKRRKRPLAYKCILVTGGEGTMGSYIKSVFPKSEVLLAGKNFLDVTDKNKILQIIKQYKPDLVIHLAALTNVDFCEQNPSIATKVNYEGTKNVALACRKFHIPLIYVSTAAVFDGKNPPNGGYTERNIPNPTSVYAKTKFQGEKIIKKLLKKFYIIRIGWLIGGGKKDKKFISYVFDKIKQGETINAVNDRFGTIAYAKDVIEFIKEISSYQRYGLYHFACNGKCSRFDIVNVLRDTINKDAKIIPVASKMFEADFPAPRPKMEILRSTKSNFNKPWQEVLKQYVKQELL